MRGSRTAERKYVATRIETLEMTTARVAASAAPRGAGHGADRRRHARAGAAGDHQAREHRAEPARQAEQRRRAHERFAAEATQHLRELKAEREAREEARQHDDEHGTEADVAHV